MPTQGAQAFSGCAYTTFHQTREGVVKCAQVAGKFRLVRAQHLSCDRWCWGALVGNKIGDGKVDFVTDGTDHGDLARSYCARQAFVVKSGEILCRTSAAGQEYSVEIPTAIGEFQGRDNRRRCVAALDGNRQQRQFNGRKASLEDAEDIADGRAAG